MRILIAPTAYKGSLSPASVANAMKRGVDRFAACRNSQVDVDLLPIADGGDGTVEALALSCGGRVHQISVRGALGEPRLAQWLELNEIAVVELASACGIAGIAPEQLRPLEAHTQGLGSVIKHVLKNTSIEKIVIALGGSASTDGGAGALVELGAKFFDAAGNRFIPQGGASLRTVAKCDLSALRNLTAGRHLIIATDVVNPLLGPHGAAAIFGPQKGASAADVDLLDLALKSFAVAMEANLSAESLGRIASVARIFGSCTHPSDNLAFRDRQGMGAAGGTAFGLAIGLDAPIISGFDWIADLVRLQEKVVQSDLVITGEGRIDISSLHGKVIGSLYELCKLHRKCLWLVAGSVSDSSELKNLSVDLLSAVSREQKFADENDISEFIFNALVARF